MDEILQNAKIGIWVIEISNKENIRPRMFANENMINLLGLEHSLNPEDLYQYWFDRINKPYLSYIENAIVKLMNGKKSEVEYLWNHPKLGWIYVRCGGYLHSNDGTCSRDVYKRQEQPTVISQALRKSADQSKTHLTLN